MKKSKISEETTKAKRKGQTSRLCLSGLLAILVCACQSIEPFSIDYLQPADVNFPPELCRVAIVNNMPDTPDNRMLETTGQKAEKEEKAEIATQDRQYNGNPALTAESLAEAIAAENYFDEVVICDSALRARDITPREPILSREEVGQLVRQLDVDFLIAVENVQMRALRKIELDRYYGLYIGSIDLNVCPTVRIYLPNRQGPMLTINGNDSIFWEATGSTFAATADRLISEKELIEQASEFAGTIPVRYLLPSWKTANRYLFMGGSVNMRDAAVYVREGNWPEAVREWETAYRKQKGDRKRFYAAVNLAVGYEMQDSIGAAVRWASEALQLAQKVDKWEEKTATGTIRLEDVPNVCFVTNYLDELEKRQQGIGRLNVQMQRLNDDF